MPGRLHQALPGLQSHKRYRSSNRSCNHNRCCRSYGKCCSCCWRLAKVSGSKCHCYGATGAKSSCTCCIIGKHWCTTTRYTCCCQPCLEGCIKRCLVCKVTSVDRSSNRSCNHNRCCRSYGKCCSCCWRLAKVSGSK